MKTDQQVLGLWSNYELCDDFEPVLRELLKQREQMFKVAEMIFEDAAGCGGHDFEPNTTMDFFRCEKCGLPAIMARPGG